MNLLKPAKIEDQIVKLLIPGEAKTTALLSDIRSSQKDITKQGFYAALRKLKRDEVVLTYKGMASLDRVWIGKMNDVFATVNKTYQTNQALFDVLGLENKESVMYTFTHTKSLDTFWGHSQNIIMHNTPETEPIYAYNTHYWIHVARHETEKAILDEIVKHKRQFLISFGYGYPLDLWSKAELHSDYLQCNIKRMYDDISYYITVIGDFITEVYLDPGLSKKIHDVYRTAKKLDPVALEKLNSFVESRGRNRIKISRNKARAEKLKKKLGKDFYIIRAK